MQYPVKRRPTYLWTQAAEDKPGLIRRILWAIERILPRFFHEPMGYGRILPGCEVNCSWWVTYPANKKSAADAGTSAAHTQGTNDMRSIAQKGGLVK